MHAGLFLLCALLGVEAAPAASPAELAIRLDRRLNERIDAEQAVAAERSSDEEFFWRVSLDLIGRIPTSDEVRAFLADNSGDKRAQLIDRLVADKQHAAHFARVWRALLLPEAEVEPQLRYFEPGLETWLAQRRGDNIPFDQIVRELLTVPLPGADGQPEMVLRDMRRANPLAFIAAKGTDPAKLAASTVRVFLGLRLECAQCHDHPFENWSQRQFWNQAAFFAGIERRGRGTFAPLVEVQSRRTIPLMDSQEIVPPLFLDQSQPRLSDTETPRRELARWLTSIDNPFFARAAVNRVWSQFFGRGLVDPVDDLGDSNPPSHPELLEELAKAFAASNFDLSLVYRTLCRTEAYGRTSRVSHPSQQRGELFARMPVRAMSGEQFFNSLSQSILYESVADRSPGEPDRDSVRQKVINLFSGGMVGDPQTSVGQALALMNGEVVADAVVVTSSARLKRLAEQYADSPARQLEELYLSTLSRLPTDDEKQTIEEFLGGSALGESAAGESAAGEPPRWGDVFWMLLNSAEFAWNH